MLTEEDLNDRLNAFYEEMEDCLYNGEKDKALDKATRISEIRIILGLL
jgi:hypothetical protein